MSRHDRPDLARPSWARSPDDTADPVRLLPGPSDSDGLAFDGEPAPAWDHRAEDQRVTDQRVTDQRVGEARIGRPDGGATSDWLRVGPGPGPGYPGQDAGDVGPWSGEDSRDDPAISLDDLLSAYGLDAYTEPPDGDDAPRGHHDPTGPGPGVGRERHERGGPGRSVRRDLAGRLPAVLRGAVWDPATQNAVILALVTLTAAAIAAVFAWHGRPTEVGAEPSPAPTSHPSAGYTTGGWVGPASAWSRQTPTASPSPTSDTEVVVDVAGRVRQPGVVTLPAGSRVVDAIAKAGGVVPGTDTSGLALARPLMDGEQIFVDGKPGPAPPVAAGGSGSGAGPGGAAGASAPAGPVHLNSATAEQFDTLPGVGPVLAQRIVQWRDANGPFTSPDQLGDVPGVGDARLRELLPLITL